MTLPSRVSRTVQWIIAFGLLALVTGCAVASTVSRNQPGEQISLSDCQIAAPGLPMRVAARCGQLSVPEDRSQPAGRQIALKIAIIPAISRNPASDPLVFLTGGPGQAATESYLQYTGVFERINQKRAIILVDQRGTGQSNPLVCPSFNDAGEETNNEQIVALLQDCLKGLEANPAQYTTWIAAEDLDQVREALGYQKINLYGISYGTRMAQTYMKRYPDRVRAAILDGVVPQAEALGADVAIDAQRALDQIIKRCEKEADCNQAFPQFRQEFNTLLEHLKNNPQKLTLAHPLEGKEVGVKFNADALAATIRLLSYAPETVSLLPMLVHNAYASKDYHQLAAQYLIVTQQLSDSISEGMGYTVICTEDVPFLNLEEIRQKDRATYLGDVQVEALTRICSVWPHGSLPPGFKDALRSDTPVMILSGENDPVTPPENGAQVAAGLSNSLHLVAPGQGHGVITRGCIARLATMFIEQGTGNGLDTACVQEIQPMPFFVNYAGPMP